MQRTPAPAALRPRPRRPGVDGRRLIFAGELRTFPERDRRRGRRGWAGAFSAANDGEALARFAYALKIVHNTLGARELRDYDPSSTLFTLLRAVGAG